MNNTCSIKQELQYPNYSLLKLFHFITCVIVNSEAVSCERTVAFATAQISQHICRGAVSACRGEGENAAVYSKEKFHLTNQVHRDSMQCHKTYHSTLE